MKRICVAMLIPAIVVFAVSCKKAKTEPAVITPLMYVPSSDAPYMAALMGSGHPDSVIASPLSDVWGIFLSVRLEGGFSDTAGHGYEHYEDWQQALFCGTDGTGFTGPKAVSINNSAINQVGNYYFSEGVWRAGELNHWEATRNDQVPEVSANIQGSYPSFSGAFPAETAFLNNDYTYTFNPNKVTDADSGYLLFHSNGQVVKSNTVSVKYGANNTAVISKAKLANMHNEYFTLDDHVIWGGVRVLVLFKDTVETFENKKFAFVSQREIVGKVLFK